MLLGNIFSQVPVLTDRRVELRILRQEDFRDLCRLAAIDLDWTYYSHDLSIESEAVVWLKNRLSAYDARQALPFVIIDQTTHELAGSTSLANFSLPDRRVEIGWTWLGKAFQGTGLNKHAKYLLLQYAFETWNMERVEFKTDVLNQQSRKALKNIGATEEGVLRSHTLMINKRRRDSIFYSILRREWPEVKKNYFPDLG